MTIYNNPAIGQGFSALAAAFAPPSGSDLAGYAAAKAKKEEASRLAQAFQFVQSPNYNRDQAERMAFALGQVNGTNGYYAQDQNNAATIRGQDVTAGTSRANNSADNARALEERRMQEAGLLSRQFAEPLMVNEGQTAILPQATQDATGLGGMYSGAVKLNPGEVANLPDGRVMAGTPKPMSETEVIGAILQGMPAADQRNKALGDIPVEQIIANDGTPQIVARPDAVGQTPYDKPTGATETQNYQAPKNADGAPGATGTAYFDTATKKWLDTQTGQPVPAGAATFSANLQGGNAETGMGGKFTERDSVISLTGETMAPGVAALNQAYAGNLSASTGSMLVKSVFGDNPAVKDIAQRVGIINPDDQLIMGAINSVMNFLYLQTGAARTPGEDDRGYAEIVPLGSDTPENRQLKLDAFNQKTMAIINQAKDPLLRAKLKEAIGGVFKSPRVNTTVVAPPSAAVEALRANPDKAADFDEMFGAGAAATALGVAK